MKPCIVPTCGEPSPESRCPEHRAREREQPSPRALGYDTTWDKLSRRARKMQPWCSDCGTTEDLTTDHLPIAWERKRKGKSIRIKDVDVVCRPCNSRRGAARGEQTRGEDPTRGGRERRGEAKSPLHTPGGMP